MNLMNLISPKRNFTPFKCFLGLLKVLIRWPHTAVTSWRVNDVHCLSAIHGEYKKSHICSIWSSPSLLVTQTKFLFRIYHVSSKSMTPLPLIPRDWVKRHFSVGDIFAILLTFIVFFLAESAVAVIDVMLHCNSVSRPSWLLINFKDFSSLRVIFQLLLERIVWAGIIMARKSPPPFWSFPMAEWRSKPAPSKSGRLVLYRPFGLIFVESWSSNSRLTLSIAGRAFLMP